MEKKIRFEGEISVSSLHGPGDQRYCLIELDEILRGRLYHENGNLLYEGDFHYGQPSGQGKIYWESGNLWYEGELEGGTLRGYGTLYDQHCAVLTEYPHSETSSLLALSFVFLERTGIKRRQRRQVRPLQHTLAIFFRLFSQSPQQLVTETRRKILEG